MAPKKIYKKAYVDIAIDMALARSKISNRMVASRLDVAEATIRNWRKEHHDFDLAFTDARELLREKINNTARASLDLRKRKTVIKDGKGTVTKTITEDVIPTARDVAVFGAKLGLGDSIHGEYDEKREILKRVIKRNIDGELTALDAAKLLEAEGISVPATLLLEVKKALGINPDSLPPKENTVSPEQTPEIAAEAYKKMMG